MADLPPLEAIADEVIRTFEIQAPPVPIERMLQHPQGDMWEEVNLAQLTNRFFNLKDPYATRMSLARLLARQLSNSEWGHTRGLHELTSTNEDIYACARMIIMPFSMVHALSSSAREPDKMRLHFEVPEEDARLRLIDLSGYL